MKRILKVFSTLFSPQTKLPILFGFAIISFNIFCTKLLGQSTAYTNDNQNAFKRAVEQYNRKEYQLSCLSFSDIQKDNTLFSLLGKSEQESLPFYVIGSRLNQNDAAYLQQGLDFLESSPSIAWKEMMAYTLGEYYFRNGNFEESLKYYALSGIGNLSNEQIAEMKYHQAYSLFSTKKFQEAKPLFNVIRQIPESPNYYDANYYYGFIAFSEKKYKEASTAFSIAEGVKPYNKLVSYYITQIHYFNNEKEKALQKAEHYLKQGGHFYDLQLRQLVGCIYLDKRDYKKALPYLESYFSKTTQPERIDLYQLSYCYYETGNTAKAIEGFKKLGGIEDSLSQNSMYLLADAYLKIDQKDNARSAFLFCKNNSSNLLQQEASSFHYAKLSFDLGYLDLSLSELRHFIIKYPNSTFLQEAKELLIATLAKGSNYAESLELFQSLKSQSEQVTKLYPLIVFERSVELFNEKRYFEADSLLSQVLKIPYNNRVLHFAYFWKGELAYIKDKPDSCIYFLNKYLLHPQGNGEVNETNARYDLGYAYLKKGEYANANRFFQEIAPSLKINSSELQQESYLRSADCYFMVKQYATANKMYGEVVEYQLKGGDYACYQQAVIAGALNKQDEKLRLLKKLLEKYPNSSYAPDANMEIAEDYILSEQYESAAILLENILKNEKAISFWPKARLKKGICLFNTNKPDEALSYFAALVKQFPNTDESDEATDYIREIYITKQKPELYLNFMKMNGRTVSVSEEDTISFRSAQVGYEQRRFDSAKTAFENYTKKFPEGKYFLDAKYFLAEIYISEKNQPAALSNYKYIADNAPNRYAERSSLQAAKIFYFINKDLVNATTYFKQAKYLCTQQEQKLDAMRGLLRCQFKLKQYSEAVDNAKELLQETGIATDDKIIATMVVAKASYAANNYEDAVTDYKKVLSYGKNEYAAEAQYSLAEILFVQEKNAKSEEAAFEVIKKFGSYTFWVTKAYLLLGDIYFKNDDLFNAEATYKSVAANAEDETLKQTALKKTIEVLEAKNKK